MDEEPETQEGVRDLSRVTQLVNGRPGVGTQEGGPVARVVSTFPSGRVHVEVARCWTVSCGIPWMAGPRVPHTFQRGVQRRRGSLHIYTRMIPFVLSLSLKTWEGDR